MEQLPLKNRRLVVYVSEQLMKAIDKLSRKKDVSRSQAVRETLKDKVDEEGMWNDDS